MNGAPAPQDYQGLAQQQAQQQNAMLGQQTQANRPNQTNAFGVSSNWSQGPDGQWSQSTQFGGPLGGLNQSLQQQAAAAMGTPFSLEGLPGQVSGQEARDQAISSAYGQATSRLDPQFQQREDALRTRLLNQGLAEGSEAYNNALQRFSQERNDAYGGAMANAIGQGTTAGNALFNQGMASRQQALAELLRGRGQAFGELQALGGLTGQAGFSQAGLGQAPQMLQAGAMQDAAAYRQWQDQQQQQADLFGAGMDLLGTGASFFLCDARAKEEVHRLPYEVEPGVPLATWRYRPDMGPGGLHVGVVAQDLARARPEAVRARPDGLLEVNPAYAPLRLED